MRSIKNKYIKNYISSIALILIVIFIYPHISTAQQDEMKIGNEKVDRYNALSADYIPTDLKEIAQEWNYHGSDYKKFVRAEVFEKLNALLLAARKDGVNLRIVSAYRSYAKQERLYNSAVRRKGPDQKTTAKPGHSEHQLGTAIDFATSDPSTALESSFGETKAYQWLKNNATRFGFYQTYREDNQKITGYIPEPWHFRYLGTSD